MKILNCFIAFTLILFSCQEQKKNAANEQNIEIETKVETPQIEKEAISEKTAELSTVAFEKNDVSFEYPDTWTVMRNESFADGDTHLVIIRKENFSAMSFVLIQWSNDNYEIEEYIDVTKDFIDQTVGNNGLELSASETGSFNTITALTSDFTFEIMDYPCEGVTYTFKKGGKTFGVTKMGAIDDKTTTNTVFDLVEKSLTVK